MKLIAFPALFVLLLVCGVASAAEVPDPPELKIRPQADQGPTIVDTVIFVLDVDGIDTPSQSFSANVYLSFEWDDPRLAHGRDGIITYRLDEVWHPQIQLVNQQKLFSTFQPLVQVNGEGRVKMPMRYWGSFAQPLDLGEYPFDTQEFAIRVVASGHREDTLQFRPSPDMPSGLAKRLSIPDWENIEGELVEAPYYPLPGLPAISGVAFRFRAERRTGYFWIKVIFPLILIVMMSWVVFWIDPEQAGTQVSVTMTSMLTLIAYRFAVGAALPKLSYLSRLDYFILGATILVFLAMVEVITTSYLASTGSLASARKVDRFARVAFPLVFAAVVLEALAFQIIV